MLGHTLISGDAIMGKMWLPLPRFQGEEESSKRRSQQATEPRDNPSAKHVSETTGQSTLGTEPCMGRDGLGKAFQSCHSGGCKAERQRPEKGGSGV